ncbi:leucine--tRNA ligase [bacterium (candidate division B38) B3_B38]|nr:MAG: leucine--tRNA ligase [bacterium (candidate division B38) B3_B38]
MTESYDFKNLEAKWQSLWAESREFEVTEDPTKPELYCLEMLPYPSGGGIHMGHVRNYSIGDVVARYKRMSGYNVLHPIGWDSLGMPAENAAIQHKAHPARWTLNNIKKMRAQLKRMGYSYAWDREVTTCLPEYYKWNQWFFLKMMERGLVYRQKGKVNWCPNCQTVLANEQAEGGHCWRCETEVEEREQEQWFFKITAYADRLLEDMSQLVPNWPENVLTMQRNWIGKSVGVRIGFPVVDSNYKVETFTTRIDTIYGATFLILSSEHPLIGKLIEGSPEKERVLSFIERQKSLSYKDRIAAAACKEGVFTGSFAYNPFTNKLIPIWVANFVLIEYGTGAVMGVPAHDERDFEFALQYGLPIKVVIQPPGEESDGAQLDQAYTGEGVLVNSGEFNSLPSPVAIERMTEYIVQQGIGQRNVDYRLMDWGISRQRYWGTPIPIVYCPKCGTVPVPEEELPVLLPEIKEITGTGGSPISQVEEFVNTKCPKCNEPAWRETDTMDTFVDSSWYHLRYTDAKIDTKPLNPEAVDYWMPVDLYIGGIEHAVMHLMYFRFFNKVLKDMGLVKVDEPVVHLLTQGMVIKDGAKMSKSKGNVVEPKELIERYGADSTRLFCLFAAPPEKDLDWNDQGIEGCYRFLSRLWRIANKYIPSIRNLEELPKDARLSAEAKKLRVKTHQTIKKVTIDIEERMHFNTALSSIMELVNELYRFDLAGEINPDSLKVVKETIQALVLLLSPFAPHLCEELWQRMGNPNKITFASWPIYNAELATEEKITVVVQINGKLRSRLTVDSQASDEEIKREAMADKKVLTYLQGKKIVKSIYVPKKLINIVVK